MNDLIKRYFPGISALQYEKFKALKPLYHEWNSKINVISRKDIDNFELHHLVHSLGISKVTDFAGGTRIMDAGTGGGFPGIPLAIMYPDVSFTLVDSIRKKTIVADSVVSELELVNVKVICSRAEDIDEKFDFVVSRAVTAFPRFIDWTLKKILPGGTNQLKNGIIYLKGGDLDDELGKFRNRVTLFDLQQFFTEDFFSGKKVVYMPA